MHFLLAGVYSLFLPLLFLLTPSVAQLSPSFYAASCPQAVSTVTNTFLSLARTDNVVAPSTLRLIVHDCFVEGCDGSILLSSTAGNTAERDAPDNLNLPQNAFDAIVAAKKAVEQICPGVVSCADILALGARDSVVFLGGPSWDVPLGRLDGRVSTAASVAGRLPGANFDVQQLMANFGSVGLSMDDMVILSGAHTVGFSHCDQFKNRLYNFNSTVSVDPSMDPAFVQHLQQKCPANGADNLQPLDVVSPFTFDSSYFQDLQAGKGLLFSDQVLFQDASTRPTVQLLAGSQATFFSKFVDSMIKMSAIGVKQGAQGEVRKDCTLVNSGGGGTVTPATPAFPPPQQSASTQPPPSPQLLGSPPPLPPSPSPPPPPSPQLLASPPPPSPPPPPQVLVSQPPPSPPSAPQLLASPPPPSPQPPTSPSFLPPPIVSPPSPPSPTISFIPPPSVVAEPPPASATEPPPPPTAPQLRGGGGFTIPGIPGLTPPIHVPFPGFGRGPPPSGSGNAGSPAKT